MTKTSKSTPPSTALAAGRTAAWPAQTAKAHFGQVFRLARTQGPQRITKGKEAVVLVSEEHFNQLVEGPRQPRNLVQFFRQSPLVGVELDLERDRDVDPTCE